MMQKPNQLLQKILMIHNHQPLALVNSPPQPHQDLLNLLVRLSVLFSLIVSRADVNIKCSQVGKRVDL